jgi:hypothetical protein
MKNFKAEVDTKIFENPTFLEIWRVLSGCLFLPLENDIILKQIREFLRTENKNLPVQLRKKFQDYLDKFYFNKNAPSFLNEKY